MLEKKKACTVYLSFQGGKDHEEISQGDGPRIRWEKKVGVGEGGGGGWGGGGGGGGGGGVGGGKEKRSQKGRET